MNRYIIYITNQQKFVDLARASARSVKQHISGAYETWLFFIGDNIENDSGFDRVVKMAETPGVSWWHQQTLVMPAIIERFRATDRLLYLDCDTYALGDVSPLFDLLGIADFAGAFSPRRYINHPSGDHIPRSFAEYNIGVNAMIPNIQMYKVWTKACEIFEAFKDGCDDQVALRAALWWILHEDPRFRISAVPPEWNLRFNFPCAVGKDVIILHGVADDLEAVGAVANKHASAMRGWTGSLQEGLK